MTKKIFRSVFLSAIVVLLSAMVLIVGVLYTYVTNVSQEQLKNQLTLAAQGLEKEGSKYFDDLETDNVRITWIAADGTVIYDSKDPDTSSMENHLQREEVQEAIKTGYGESRRYSTTLMTRLMYAAKKMNDGTILRLAISQYSILTLLLGMAQPIILIVILAIVLSLFLANGLAKSVVKPLNEIDLDHPLENDKYDELSPLLRRISSQQDELALQKTEISRKQEELNTILGNMSEGMILLHSNGHIMSINSTAMAVLGLSGSCIGRSLVSVYRNLDFDRLVESALQGNGADDALGFEKGRYQVIASPVKYGNHVQGATVVLFDVTDRERAEQMRREFTANVSHELKTPLHAISGYSELLKENMVKPEDVQPFAGKIYNEAQRTIQLVEDIISLSHLDEGAGDMKWEKVDLYQTAREILDEMESKARASQVSLALTGYAVPMKGVPALIHTLVNNLCDNAIKYNHPGGHVTVDVRCRESNSETAGTGKSGELSEIRSLSQGESFSHNGRNQKIAVISVSDDGIGIPEKDQQRIFERFYRVDKSHSRAVGGTGLGLSIVKHAVQIHDGRISLKSEQGKGTTIKVELPIGK